ncbi:MAG: alkaline phosphatase family protein [Planctomyces sp.]|nr:alkaline phosphatase family protein [Planctomyces sp.]
MRRLMVLNVVGLTSEMIGPGTPNLLALSQNGFLRPMQTVLPAVTCSVQASMLTGRHPQDHGIVGNGWYDRDLSEVMFWKQSNRLIQSERVYEMARRQAVTHTTAKMFWWFNMYADVAWSVTPRPSYPADGRKIPDIYSEPESLRDELQERLGKFPLFNFWGPTADIKSTAWITDASLDVWKHQRPDLMLVYLPHLDYNLQRLGPSNPAIQQDIAAVDRQAGRLIEEALNSDASVLVVSEYGITETNRPIHLNRILREQGYLRVRREPLGWETLDCGASRAFAVADHQVAHVYVRRPSDVAAIQRMLMNVPGIERVLDRVEQKSFGIAHQRSGDLVVISERDAWFTYYFWQDDALAPDYARTVDIHRKPGYDPVELFIDPELQWPKVRVLKRLIQKKLGFRYYMDVIGLNAEIVRGSHGRLPDASRMESDAPVLICSDKSAERDKLHVCDVQNLILSLQFRS